MKKILTLTLLIQGICVAGVSAQSLKDLLRKKGTDTASSAPGKLQGVLQTISRIAGQDSLNTQELGMGLKEALEKGATNGSRQLSATDGFFRNAAVKILLPPEAVQVEKTIRTMGLGKLADDAILTINRAAEDAAKSAGPIFIQAIRQLTWRDAWAILNGGDMAATEYLRNITTLVLTEAFRPVISQSLEKTGATRYWSMLFTNYNRFSQRKVNPDLTAYAVERALNGIFYQIGQEERAIRQNPAARTSALLQKVFGGRSSQSSEPK